MSGNEQKGIVFTLDAVAAVAVLAMFVGSLAFLAAKSTESSYSHVLLERQADDALLVLDKANVFLGKNATRLGEALNYSLGGEISYQFNLSIYDNSGDGNLSLADSMNITRNVTAASISKAKLIATSVRTVVLPQAGNRSQFGIAALSVWKG